MAQYLAWQRLDGASGHTVAWDLLAQLYAAHVGSPMPPILRQGLGKPYFQGENWHFSISHSQNHAFCVLSDQPVGIDAEELSRQVSPLLAEKILSPEEKAQFDTAADKNRALLTFWVLKEAQGKCTGKGIGFHPNQTHFSLTDRRVQEIDGTLVAIITEDDHVI